ncbi:hypothetical protein J8A71_02975 [Mycoplasmopsis agalactiae]|uniref:S8 family serine peptidase n=1 Tax=Mycoplasmopsis agalactiae TaxID=2110 RepID=UPI001F427FDB|nr:S8 family serine peptidase [Mycoplasmopsis agalactiae]MCE6061848.1 hypothetical protein [Mycoplasmopsis agalactiae]
MNKSLKFLCAPAYFMPMIMVATSLPNNDNKIQLNANSSETISEALYNKLIKLYKPYYDKLGILDRDDKHQNYESNKYDKVGIIELHDTTGDYFLSQNKNFHFKKIFLDKTKDSNITIDDHGYAVCSLIGTDTGINPNALLYYSSLNDANIIDYIKNFYENYDIKLINMSLGPTNPYDLIYNISNSSYSKNIFTKYKNAAVMNSLSTSDKKRLKHSYLLLAKAIVYFTLFENEQIYNLSSIKKNYSEIGKYAQKNNIKIIQSSGNDNNEITNEMGNNEFLNQPEFMENGMISKDKIYSSFQSFFNQTPNTRMLRTIRAILDKAFNNNNWIYDFDNNWISDFDFPSFIDPKIRKEKLFKALSYWQSLHYHDGIISVGSLNWGDIASPFSSFTKENTGTYPLISAYGNSYKDDKESIIIENKYKSIYDNIKSYVDEQSSSSKLRKKIKYLLEFIGTSKSAPLITGLISRLQHKLNRELSISEVKLLLTSSANYSKTNASKNTKFSFDELSSEHEYWRKNWSKNKTGFGVPKYFKMENIWKSQKIRKSKIHNIFNNDISSYPAKQFYYESSMPKLWRQLNSTFIWDYKMSFSDYLKLNYPDNDANNSLAENQWIKLFYSAIRKQTELYNDWWIDQIPLYSIEAKISLKHDKTPADYSATIYSNEYNTSVQRIRYFHHYPELAQNYKIYITLDELNILLHIFWDYIIRSHNLNIAINNSNNYYETYSPIIAPYKKYVSQIVNKYLEYLRNNVSLINYSDFT